MITFTLPFAFLPSLLRVAVFLVILTSGAFLVFKLYRAELRRVSPRVARLLLALRLGAFAAVFAVVAAAPVVVRVVTEAKRGRVVVAVDVSDSMRIADPDRPVGEKLSLVRALKLHDGVASDEVLGGWIEDVERSGAPHFPPPDTDAGVARRAAFDELVSRANTITRAQVAARILAPEGGEALDRLKSYHTVELLGFGQTAAELPDGPASLNARPAGAEFTDLKAPLGRAADGRGDLRLAGVVLLTDGRHNWGESPLAAAGALAGKGVPVYAVNLAPRDPPVDVAVVTVTPAVTTACRGSSVVVEVRVRATRWPAGPIDLTLKFADGRPPLTQTVNHAGGDQVFDITFHPRLDRVGLEVLTAEATTTQPDRVPANNTRTARVNVVDAKPRVLLIDGESRWEHHYLHAALSRSTDPPLDVKSVVFRQPRLGKPEDVAELPALKLPADPDALTGFDCVVLGDASAEQLPRADRERLEKYVSDAGGTLVVVAGKRAMPFGFPDANDPLESLLPVKNLRAVAPPDGFLPVVTADGERSWFLRLGDTTEQSRTVWEDFPPHFWGVVGEAKDGADVLAWVRDPTRAAPERQSALIARHHFGFGRVLFVGLDSTWRWRFKTGDEHHHRFWKQTIQWAAADRLLATANAECTIRFGTREPTYHGNQEVEFVLRANESVPPLAGSAAVKLFRQDAAVGTFPLAERPGNPRERTAKFRDLPPGRYAAEPDIPEWAEQLRGNPGRLRSAFEVLPPESDEMTELSGNVALLEELAAVGGGRVFDVSNVGELVDVMSARSSTREVESRTPLRRSWWTLAVVVLLLTTEWVVRKFAGLA